VTTLKVSDRIAAELKGDALVLVSIGGSPPIAILFAIAAIVALLRLRPVTVSRTVRGVSLALVLAQAAAIAGQVGEEIAVLQHGGLSAGKDVFEDPLHMTSAWVTIPGLLLSQILLIVLTIAALLAMRAEGRRSASLHQP